MDDAIAAARQSLAVGEPLVALPYVALRDDPPALALRGIAMAQLGDWSRARELLSRAARAFGPDSRVERGRCLLAEAEVALAQRDLAWSPLALHHALRSLKARGDHINVLHARILLIRRMLLLGDLTRALPALTALNLEGAPAALAATAELARAELALRRVQVSSARAALQRARRTAQRAGIPALLAEVNRMQRTLSLPAARLMTTRSEHTLRLGQVERLLASNQLVINGVQRCLSHGAYQVRMRRRPVLFSLLQTLGEHWPAQATREVLIARAFGSLRPNSSHRSRLRVEISRLRTAIRSLAQIQATPDGFKLAAHEGTPRRRFGGVSLAADRAEGKGSGRRDGGVR